MEVIGMTVKTSSSRTLGIETERERERERAEFFGIK
jgi:hypothetical protein